MLRRLVPKTKYPLVGAFGKDLAKELDLKVKILWLKKCRGDLGKQHVLCINESDYC